MLKGGATFGEGVATLGMTGLLCGALGSVFRIALAHMMGDGGMAYYQMVYPVYSLLSVVATVGVPAAISRQISIHIAREDYRNARAFFLTAFAALSALGAAGAAVLWLFRNALSSAQGMPDGGALFLAIAPAVFFGGVICALRGYFQGLQRMKPTAASLVIQEVGKSVVGFALMLLNLQKGSRAAALGAVWGIPAAEFAAAFYLMMKYLHERDRARRMLRQTPKGYAPVPPRERLRVLWRLSAPITISAAALPLIGLLDNVLVVNVLKLNGFSQNVAQMRFGLLSGVVSPVVFVPMALVNAIVMGVVPAVSASAALGRTKEVEAHARVGIRLALLFALPCVVGLFVAGPQLLTVLFHRTLADATTMRLSAALVRTLGAALGFLMVAQTASGVLHGLGEAGASFRHLMGGAVIKLVISYVLMRMPTIHITGAALGTLCAYACIAGWNLRTLKGVLRAPYGLRGLWPIAFASGAMGVVTYLGLQLAKVLPLWAAVAAAIALSMGCYAFLVLRLRLIGPQECRLLPGGLRLDALMHRIGWWR